MEWVGKWGRNTMTMFLRGENDEPLARYRGENGYWEIDFYDKNVDHKTEYTRMTDMTEDEVQTYIKHKYLLLRGG